MFQKEKDVVNAFDARGAEVEYRVVVPSVYATPPEGEPSVEIGISAVGGGTVGESYAYNSWMWGVWADGVLLLSGDDLSSGAWAASHAEMAVTLCAFLANDGESFYLGYEPEAGDAAADYSAAAREFLVAEHERFAMFHAEEEAEAA